MNKLLISGGVVLALIIGWLLLPESTGQPNGAKQPADVLLRDAHGMAVDRNDSSKLYIATHTGLLVMDREGRLTRIGTAQDDYMGFSVHPNDANIFYTSGHPRSGGNLGFQRSTDGGSTWQKISNGVNGPVDFHTMTVSQAEPNVLYGAFRGQLQRSRDEGKNWEIIPTAPSGVFTLTTSRTDAGTVYAGTADGLYISNNQGQDWKKLEGINTATSLVAHPVNGEELLAYSQDQGILRSRDAGVSWTTLNGYSGAAAMHLAYDPSKPETAYLINRNLEIYRTTDNSNTWAKIR